MKTDAPSLIVWGWVVALFAGFQLALILLPENAALRWNAELDLQVRQLEIDFEEVGQQGLKVAVIGTSLTRCGIANHNELQQLLPISNVNRLAISRIYLPGNHLRFLSESARIFDRLLELPRPPDIVLLQTELIAIRFPDLPDVDVDDAFRSGFHFRRANFRNFVRSCLYKPKVPTISSPDPDADRIATGNESLFKRVVAPIEYYPFVYPKLQRLTEEGIRVVLLDIPKPSALDRRIHSGDFEPQFRQLLSQYKQRFEISYLAYTGPELDYIFFRDAGHMNDNGKRIYTRWLSQKLLTGLH